MKVSEGGGYSPRWAADDDPIFYFRRQSDSEHLWAARIDRGPPMTVLGQDSLMAWPDGIPASFPVDLHPDGDRFIGHRQAEETRDEREPAEPVRYFVVTHWFEEMRARLGGGG